MRRVWNPIYWLLIQFPPLASHGTRSLLSHLKSKGKNIHLPGCLLSTKFRVQNMLFLFFQPSLNSPPPPHVPSLPRKKITGVGKGFIHLSGDMWAETRKMSKRWSWQAESVARASRKWTEYTQRHEGMEDHGVGESGGSEQFRRWVI